MGRNGWVRLVAIIAVSLVASGIAFWFSWATMHPHREGIFVSEPTPVVSPTLPSGAAVPSKAGPAVSTRKGLEPLKGLAPLPLKLLGLLIRKQAQESIAVIRDLEREMTGVYRIGDRLLHGATLITIASGKVTVRRSDGSLAFLPLEAADQRAGGIAQGMVTSLSPTERLIDRKALEKAPLPVLMELSQVKITPSITNGHLQGFAVDGASSDGLLSALGVEEGDVISAIDGKPLENYRRATELLGQALLHRPPFKVTILKRDRKKTFTYHLAQ